MPEVKTDIQKREAEAPEGVERTSERALYRPNVDIIEKKDGIVLIADMPGVDESSVEVTLENRVLTINGGVREEAPPEGYSAVGHEYPVGDYQRVFSVSEEIDGQKIEASIKTGVLTLKLPKAEAAKARKINVKVR